MTELITNHAWRLPKDGTASDLPAGERPCAYAGCGKPKAEHDPSPWARWQQCPVCAAELARPCVNFSGYIDGSGGGYVEVEAPRAHGGRKPRAGYGRG